MENKQRICDLLLPALQETRNLKDLLTLDYDAEKSCNSNISKWS